MCIFMFDKKDILGDSVSQLEADNKYIPITEYLEKNCIRLAPHQLLFTLS